MIPLPSDITAKDVNQWLNDGWFYALSEDGTYKVCRLLGTSDENKKAEINSIDGKSGVVTFDKLFAFWPQCGSLNMMPGAGAGETGKFAISLIRLQKKQWKRTYNGYCLKLRPISDKPEHFQISADQSYVVRAAFNPEYFTYTQAVKFMFPEGWTSVAINPNLIVYKVPEQQMVFVDGEVVGMIADDTKVFTCINPGLKRRLLPHFDYLVE